MESKIRIEINGRPYDVAAGKTVMEAADSLGFHIPRLCYHPKLSIEGACRVCIVEVEGQKNFCASCTHPVSDGMKIRTNSEELRRARRDIIELILDNHPEDCQTCERNGRCELQRLAQAVGIKRRHFTGEKKHYDKDLSSPSVVRDPDKCILCGRCVRMCSEIQQVNAIRYAHRGFRTVVQPAYDQPFRDSVCSTCGQCINVCPTAAFMEHNHAQELFARLHEKETVKVVQVAPAVRASIGEAFDLPPGTAMERQIVAALRKLGFDYVFDTQFGADLTIMEEASELLERLDSKKKLPLITSCSPGWIKAMEQFFPRLIPHVSSCKSPMSMQSAILKTYFAEKKGIDPAKILSVAVMPCTAKKFEAERPEQTVNGLQATDLVITTRELAWMIKSAGIDFVHGEGEPFDDPLGLSSGAATIFGATGGVMEAALRTAYEMATGETLIDIEFEELRGLEGIKESSVEIDGKRLNLAVANGLGAAFELMERIEARPGHYHFVEVMGCPGGCINGGGQPHADANHEPLDPDLLRKRAGALYDLDRHRTIRRSHENPHVQRIYKEFLGRPLSEKSHELLHTRYDEREPGGIRPGKERK